MINEVSYNYLIKQPHITIIIHITTKTETKTNEELLYLHTINFNEI